MDFEAGFQINYYLFHSPLGPIPFPSKKKRFPVYKRSVSQIWLDIVRFCEKGEIL